MRKSFLNAYAQQKNTAPFLVRPVSRVSEQHPSLYPAVKDVDVQRRVGGGPLTVRLSELGLTELQRLAALAGAQYSREPRSKLDGGDLFADAPVTLENRCPVALEFGQVRCSVYILALGSKPQYIYPVHRLEVTTLLM